MFIDGDFPTNKKCKYHCSPSCHPGQTDPDKWHYGCLHKAWPANKYNDFCPLVECDGKTTKCELKGTKSIKRYISGKKRVVDNLEKKYKEAKEDYQFALTIK